MNHATATRAEIREFVRINAEELLEFSRAGGNAHQKSLDQKDLLEEQLAPLTDEQRDRFYTIYAEEMEANTQHALYKLNNPPVETVDLNPQPSTVEIGSQSISGILILVVAAVVGMFVAYKLVA